MYWIRDSEVLLHLVGDLAVLVHRRGPRSAGVTGSLAMT